MPIFKGRLQIYYSGVLILRVVFYLVSSTFVALALTSCKGDLGKSRNSLSKVMEEHDDGPCDERCDPIDKGKYVDLKRKYKLLIKSNDKNGDGFLSEQEWNEIPLPANSDQVFLKKVMSEEFRRLDLHCKGEIDADDLFDVGVFHKKPSCVNGVNYRKLP